MCTISWEAWDYVTSLVWDATNDVPPLGEQAEARRLNTSRLLPDVVTYTTLLKVRVRRMVCMMYGRSIITRAVGWVRKLCLSQTTYVRSTVDSFHAAYEMQRTSSSPLLISHINRPSPCLPAKDTDRHVSQCFKECEHSVVYATAPIPCRGLRRRATSRVCCS